MSYRLSLRITLIVCCLGFALNTVSAQKRKAAAQESSLAMNTPAPEAPTAAPQAPEPKAPENDSPHWKVYRQALGMGDYQVAVTALHYELAANPSREDLKDTLASLYFTIRSYPQCILLGREILAKRPEDQRILEMVAWSYNAFGSVEGSKMSLETYEKLYRLSRDVGHLYQIATLQYGLKRYGECMMSLKQLIADPASATQKVSININQQQAQDVPIKAAAFNVAGVMQLEEKQIEQAKLSFAEALKIEPNFVLAKGNLDQLNKPAPAPKTGGK